ncbi:S53 family peptidase [Kutzneria chonburiensis]|uniref:S8 family serine peptidase n=1 Tax=Kutzneria chonburiensis TaxID=1483604 RepID=A0ABV6MW54_9PSEU|nr:S53 family peptidase [Kutzneria chonburiensis]
MLRALAMAAVLLTAVATPAIAKPALPSCASNPGPNTARCLSVAQTAADTGHGADDLRAAYNLPATGGGGQTIAIVDAYDNPNAESDLAVYRSRYGLPPCTTANGCFRKVNQRGQTTPLPAGNPGWGLEIALDLDMASTACPACHILLVEGDDPLDANLAASVNTAVAQGATVVSNSYGLDEHGSMSKVAAAYDQPGVPIVASSGDSGFRTAEFPAVLSSVIAVGGTTLTRADNARGWTETAWSSAGSGCSAWVAKPAWQHDTNCGMRTIADVSAVADKLAVHDTYQVPGWVTIGGTSASAPFIAGIIALAGNASQVHDASYLYAHADALYDVVDGHTEGMDCGGDYLCNGRPGYDAPTGLGTPNGIGAF